MRVVLTGACGKTGRTAGEVLLEGGDDVLGVDPLPTPSPFPILSDFPKEVDADVLLDFSTPSALSGILAFCRAHRLPAVLGTTGYSAQDEEEMRRFGEEFPLFRTGNFSLGVNLLRKFSKIAAMVLDGFDAEIVERHHRGKKDAPSGTAVMLAESVKMGAGGHITCGRSSPRKVGEICLHAVRGGTTAGEHEVCFYGEDESILLIHHVQSRRVFALGARRAVHWIVSQKAGVYDMDDLLDGKSRLP